MKDGRSLETDDDDQRCARCDLDYIRPWHKLYNKQQCQALQYSYIGGLRYERDTFKPALTTVITIITTQSAHGLIPFEVSATKARQSRAARVTPACFRGGLPRNPLAETL